jgi:hypothetical protein
MGIRLRRGLGRDFTLQGQPGLQGGGEPHDLDHMTRQMLIPVAGTQTTILGANRERTRDLRGDRGVSRRPAEFCVR